MENIIAKLLQDFEQGKMTRRQLIQSLALTATAASAVNAGPAVQGGDGNLARAVSINHVSYQVADYRKVRDFYAGLFGMKVSRDDGMQCRLSFGDNILIVRNRTPAPKVVANEHRSIHELHDRIHFVKARCLRHHFDASQSCEIRKIALVAKCEGARRRTHPVPQMDRIVFITGTTGH